MTTIDISKPKRVYWCHQPPIPSLCPACQSPLVQAFQTYGLWVEEDGELESSLTGIDAGFFCPECPTVVLDKRNFDDIIQAGSGAAYQVIGIVDMDAVKHPDAPLGTDDNPVPLVEFSNVNQPAKSAKLGRNDPCPCGSGKKAKKCCYR